MTTQHTTSLEFK